ncbi:TIGR03086 family protein [Saccharomonospora marina XMU15]|uniref:TIGR03086 family protein n=1 Tax=Saccharomonospora marina XMU15 TaxID=882083 RepID=H5WZP6_9PSEU|nr:TIGR03086 family metal-binding protein [Saccharomonospora marina]EHR50778.1 TIGR03086 family protein [Saccharomonospora marina XMU15]
MADRFDLAPATEELARLVRGVRDDQLGGPTPCERMTVGDLLDHVDGLAVAFTGAARKEPVHVGDPPPPPHAAGPGEGLRTRVPRRLRDLASAWREESAWSGETEAGGVTLPGEVAGVVALDEVIVHGWDLAVATGQDFRCEPALLAAALEFVRASVAEHPEGSPGLFGPPVAVPDDAPTLTRLIALTGRDPSWRPHG